ncbi:MAG: hypothetical protein AMXMBFR72_16610 [Betaproteobacteria bacterium]
MRFIRSSTSAVTASLNVRTVPAIVATSGTTFVVSPAWIIVIDSTAASIGFLLRVTMPCSPCAICTATNTGSTPR